MKNAIVRIQSVKIQDFKNVTSGMLSFENNRKPYAASILGLYGQNGSGKTALIDALSLLKFALTGKNVPAKFADYINIDAKFARLSYEFKVKTKSDVVYDVFYKFLFFNFLIIFS